MTFLSKKLLIILQLNNLLFYMNNPKVKSSTYQYQHIPIIYNDSYNNLQISLRKGKSQLLNYLFINLKNDIDVAVWSNLNNQFTNQLCHKYFTRYYRDLLFVMATNRGLYGEHPLHASIKIRKDLTNVYNKFPGYNQGNTIVATVQDNLIQNHARNDLKVPEYAPSNPKFLQDPGLTPLAKYIQGLILVKNESGINDIRRFINAKQAKNIFDRVSHNMHTDRIYI